MKRRAAFGSDHAPSEGSPPCQHRVGDRSFLCSFIASEGLALCGDAAGDGHCAGPWSASGPRDVGIVDQTPREGRDLVM